MRKNFPAGIVQPMPPDASCWLIELKNIIQSSIEAVEFLASQNLSPETQTETKAIRANESRQQIGELWNELKLACDKAVQRFPERIEDIETVFAYANALRESLIELDGIAFKNSEYGEYSVQLVDGLHTLLWKNRETFDSLSDHAKALFTWREHPVKWRGQQTSNIVEAIRNEALQYTDILHEFSLQGRLNPSEGNRSKHPEPWFDIAAVTKAASRIRERISPTLSPAENSVSTTERTFGEYFAHIAGLIDSLSNRPDMQNAIRRLMRPGDMLETFSELAVKDPDLMRILLQASVAALVNVQSVEAVGAEIKRRAVAGS